MAAPVPATPYAGTRRAWGVYAGVAGVVAAIAIVAVVFANSSSSTASLPGRPIGEPMAVAPTPGAPIATTAPAGGRASAPTPSAEPLTAAPRPVLFGIEPFDAHVFLGSQDLGSQPVTVDVPAGETVTVEVRREGYRSQPVTIDGSEKKIKLRLVKVAAARPAAPPAAKPPADTTAVKPPPPAAPPALGGGEIVNPWAK